MVKQLMNSKLGGVVLIAVGLMLSSCAPVASASGLHAAPCPPSTSENNVYRQPLLPVLGDYYRNAFLPQSNIAYEENFTNQQHEAVKFLATQTKRWSDFVDIPLEGKYVRITVTYLSPTLIQTILLNHYLYRRIGHFVNGDFNAEVMSKMEDIASRNEHIFLITLTASKYDNDIFNNKPLIVQLPLQSLVLTNSLNIQANPQHDNPNLKERLDITFTSAHGYIFYSIAVMINENCEFLLDKDNTHLVISVPFIEINGARYQTRPWVLNYVPLLNIASDQNPGETRLQVDRNIEHFHPIDQPPEATNTVDAEYWENLGRFIWHEVTLDP